MSRLFTSVVVAGKFDPLYDYDLKFLEYASRLGDDLVAIILNDHRIQMGTTILGMKQHSRADRVQKLDCIDSVILSQHGQDFRYRPATDIPRNDLSIRYELAQMRPHLFVTHSMKTYKQNIDACDDLDIDIAFVPLKEYMPNE